MQREMLRPLQCLRHYRITSHGRWSCLTHVVSSDVCAGPDFRYLTLIFPIKHCRISPFLGLRHNVAEDLRTLQLVGSMQMEFTGVSTVLIQIFRVAKEIKARAMVACS